MKIFGAVVGGVVAGFLIGVVLSGVIGMLVSGPRTSGIGLAAGALPYLGALTGAITLPLLVERHTR